MTDDNPAEDPILLAGAPLPDERLATLLRGVAQQQTPDPAFAERLRERLRAPDAQPRQNRGALPIGSPPGPAPARPVRRRARPVQIAAAALAFAAGALALGLTMPLSPSPPSLPPLPPATRVLATDAPALLSAPDGQRVGVALVARGGAQPAFQLELRDGAMVRLWPALPPLLELERGFLRVAGAAPLRLRAADQDLLIDAGADVALELLAPKRGGEPMRPLWLIPTSAASGAALTLAVLVVQGRVALSQSRSGAEVPRPGEVLVLNPHDRAAAPPQVQRRMHDLEQKVASLQQENGQLAGQLARRKGVTPASVLERIATLKNTSLAGMLSPGAHAELITDLKGLGPEGVKAMIELLESGDEKERFLAANLLEQLNAPAAISALRQAALNDPDKMAGIMAGHALALMDDAGTVPALREIADANKTWESRVNALWGLCKHGDERALAESLAMLKDDKVSNDHKAALGANLMLLSDPELMPIVDETLRQFAKSEQVGSLAVNYYSSVGTPEARARLEAMANDAKLAEAVRKQAREALAKGKGR
jgi:HEAT repeat protein